MVFNGFRSISEYERACEQVGLATERRPFRSGDEKCFVLITGLRKETGSSIKSWHLFSSDETRHLLDGVINGCNANYLGKLAAAGYYPDI